MRLLLTRPRPALQEGPESGCFLEVCGAGFDEPSQSPELKLQNGVDPAGDLVQTAREETSYVIGERDLRAAAFGLISSVRAPATPLGCRGPSAPFRTILLFGETKATVMC